MDDCKRRPLILKARPLPNPPSNSNTKKLTTCDKPATKEKPKFPTKTISEKPNLQPNRVSTESKHYTSASRTLPLRSHGQQRRPNCSSWTQENHALRALLLEPAKSDTPSIFSQADSSYMQMRSGLAASKKPAALILPVPSRTINRSPSPAQSHDEPDYEIPVSNPPRKPNETTTAKRLLQDTIVIRKPIPLPKEDHEQRSKSPYHHFSDINRNNLPQDATEDLPEDTYEALEEPDIKLRTQYVVSSIHSQTLL